MRSAYRILHGLKQFRRFVTRCDELAACFADFVTLACICVRLP